MVNGECLFLRWKGSKYAEMTTAIIIKYLQIKIDCGNSVTPQPLPDRGGGSSYSLPSMGGGLGWGKDLRSNTLHRSECKIDKMLSAPEINPSPCIHTATHSSLSPRSCCCGHHNQPPKPHHSHTSPIPPFRYCQEKARPKILLTVVANAVSV